MPTRVVLAMSGGVDSSAAAVLLTRQGYEVIGLFMRSGAAEETACATSPATSGANALPVVNARGHKQGCCSASDAADARRVADMLDIPFHALNFRDAFGRIKDYFADEYLAGRTPNPCVMCNNWLKFGKLWDFARQVGAESIATGHYARVVHTGQWAVGSGETTRNGPLASNKPPLTTDHGQWTTDNGLRTTDNGQPTTDNLPALVRGRDFAKDQSYVLFGIDRNLLGRILFPVGDYEKPAIRELAAEAGLRVADKPDSQEICFIPDNDYAGFLERYRGESDTAGELVDTAGNVVGRHDGFEQFTIGQRKRLGVTFGSPRFVVAIEPESKRVVIGTRDDLARTSLEADRLNWLADVPPRFTCQAQIRYRHEAATADVHILDEDRMTVAFTEPQYGVAPGQAVVLYDGDRVLGGGWIR